MQKRTKTFLAAILLCVVIAASIGFYMFNKPHKNVAGSKTDVQLSAEKLYNKYFTNEAEADKDFLNKVIEVKGEVAANMHKDNSYFILLKANESGGVNCQMMMTDTGLLNKIKKGETVTVKGRCDGLLMDVNLTGCIIIE